MKVEVKSSPIQGQGVFATAPIAAGEIVLVIDDSRVVDAAHPLDPADNSDHCDWLPDGTTVLMQVPERYINHSCDPNVYVYSVNKRRFVLAIRPIAPGQEIVFDYAINAAGGDVLDCHCLGPTCRGRHVPAFFVLPDAIQLKLLPLLDPWFAEVHRSRIAALLTRNAL